MKRSIATALICLISFVAYSQLSYEEQNFTIKKSHTYDPLTSDPGFNAKLVNMEAPSPDGESYRSFLMRQKIKSREKYPLRLNTQKPENKKQAAEPIVGEGFSKYSTLVNGRVIDYSGGIPNDNALAVSKDGILLSGVNSIIWAYDLNLDTIIFPKHILSLRQIGIGSNSSNYFDPQMIYDPEADRFILVFLRDNTPANSAYIICFSSTNDPRDPWNVYELPGNPLDNNRWTDFPTISITKDEVFLTANLIIPNVSWQVGFDGSIIWQLNKQDGYNDAPTIGTKLFSDIKYNGKFTRNLHCVRGLDNISKRQFFLSNRNFDVTNDSIFVMEVTGTLDNSNLVVNMAKTTPSYGVPPNGRQEDTDLSDPTKGLQTNDGRVLGAITNGDDWIQFVSTTVNPATGLAGIYHGTVSNPLSSSMSISGHIIADNVKDFGYPNIAFSGNEDCDIETIIGFNFASPTDFPGVAAVYYGNDGAYSDVVYLKDGLNYVDAHSDSYERWGDYFGIQPKFGEPGTVWTAGFFGLTNNQNGTWFNELSSPDNDQLGVQSSLSGSVTFCDGKFTVNPSGGLGPYSYSFNGGDFSNNPELDSICDGDSIVFTISDSRGCSITDTVANPSTINQINGSYPNPFTGQLVSQFELEKDQLISAYIFDSNGKLVAKIFEQNGKTGLNKLFFDLAPLRAGIYVLKVVGGEEEDEILVNKLFKRE